MLGAGNAAVPRAGIGAVVGAGPRAWRGEAPRERSQTLAFCRGTKGGTGRRRGGGGGWGDGRAWMGGGGWGVGGEGGLGGGEEQRL